MRTPLVTLFIIIGCFGITGFAFAGDYWISGQPVQTDNTNYEWSMGSTSVVVEANSVPTISSVSDSPDPIEVGNNITFSVDWDDANVEGINMYICKADDGTSSGCGAGGTWCSNSDDYDLTDPITCLYTTQSEDAGINNYYSYVCDVSDSCSSSSSGSFTVGPVVKAKLKGNMIIKGGEVKIK